MKKLTLHQWHFGYSSETYNFRIECHLNGKKVFGGRLTYFILKWFIPDHEFIDHGWPA